MNKLRLVGALIVGLAASASADTLTVLGELAPERADALRAEAAIRGFSVESLPGPGSDPVAAALAERPHVAAVLWIDLDPDGDAILWIRLPDGRRTHAPLGPRLPSGPVLAAIASNLLDELREAPRVEVRVDVRVDGAPARPVAIAPAISEEVQATSPRPWYLDVGGLVAPYGIFAAHAGVGRNTSPHGRIALIGHTARIPDQAVAWAGSIEASRTWGQRTGVRLELGLRGVVAAVIPDVNSECSAPCQMDSSANVGFGGGGFLGLGYTTSLGTFYLRGGADLMQFDSEELAITPNGTLGLELPL